MEKFPSLLGPFCCFSFEMLNPCKILRIEEFRKDLILNGQTHISTYIRIVLLLQVGHSYFLIQLKPLSEEGKKVFLYFIRQGAAVPSLFLNLDGVFQILFKYHGHF
jgi:hypothetical protein